MRNVIHEQMILGQANIANIQFDLASRDEIPKLLMGLQYIYTNEVLRHSVFGILEDLTPKGVDPDNGRTGMDYWKILVLGTLRLGCNIDYDKLKDTADEHATVRQIMGHSIFDEKKYYPLQTVKDNVSLLTPEVMDRINQEVVKHGHRLLGKTENDDFSARCDSFVVETNVHFPTDINLLLDAMGKVIHLIGLACASAGIDDWRQNGHNKNTVKKLYRKAQNAKRSNSKDPKKRAAAEKVVREAYLAYLDTAANFLAKSETTIRKLREELEFDALTLHTIEQYMEHAFRQIEQTHRRVIQGEKIPHKEKVFSIFEEHTEWISKGKAGVPQELGLRVCILQDQYGFICHHKVMRG
ncbi:MAG: ISNCY family transposase, partial [Proteobacteria bacterium]|nr:ISNCY family transposase [Pseudomonadota bacterium]